MDVSIRKRLIEEATNRQQVVTGRRFNIGRTVSKSHQTLQKGFARAVRYSSTSEYSFSHVSIPSATKVRVRNNEIAKFGTKAERNTPLWKLAQRRPLP